MQGVKVKFVINVAGSLIGIGIALLTIPIYISTMGKSDTASFHLFLSCWAISAFSILGYVRPQLRPWPKCMMPLQTRGEVFL